MANRITVKSNIVTKNVPTVTNAILTDMLNAEMCDNIQFREDVAVLQSSSVSNITVDFTGKDRVDLTRTGGSLNISVAGIEDGETKYLLITKTSAQTVVWTGVTDVTPVRDNVKALSIVLYEIIRKSTYYFARAWVDSPKTGTDDVAGVFKVATQVQSDALSVVNVAVTPGRQPLATQTQKGLMQFATETEGRALASTTKAIAPGTIPLATTAQAGVSEVAVEAQVEDGDDVDPYGYPLHVPPSELKRKIDELAVDSVSAQNIINAGTTYGALYLARVGKNVNGIFRILAVENAGARVLATYTLPSNFRPASGCGVSRRAETSGEINYIEFLTDGKIYFGIDFATGLEEQKSICFSYVTA